MSKGSESSKAPEPSSDQEDEPEEKRIESKKRNAKQLKRPKKKTKRTQPDQTLAAESTVVLPIVEEQGRTLINDNSRVIPPRLNIDHEDSDEDDQLHLTRFMKPKTSPSKPFEPKHTSSKPPIPELTPEPLEIESSVLEPPVSEAQGPLTLAIRSQPNPSLEDSDSGSSWIEKDSEGEDVG